MSKDFDGMSEESINLIEEPSDDEAQQNVLINEALEKQQGGGEDEEEVEEEVEEETDDNSECDKDDDDISTDENDLEIIESTLEQNDIVSVHETYSEYYTTTKITSPFLTKFERAKLIGVRAQMLASGAEPLISPPFPDECYKIAEQELQEKKIPLIIRRYLPNKRFEDWRLEDLIIKNI